MTKRTIEAVSAMQTELSGWARLTPPAAMAKLKQTPQEFARWTNAALSVLPRWEGLVQELRDDPDAASLLANLEQFDRGKVTAGARVVLEIVLSQTEREARFAIDKSLGEAATFSRIVLEQSQRLESLRAAADKAVGPFAVHKIGLSTELRKALTTVAHGRLEVGGKG